MSNTHEDPNSPISVGRNNLDDMTCMQLIASLGLNRVAGDSFDVLKKDYKILMLNTHPDKNSENPNASDETKRITEIWRVLKKKFHEGQYADEMKEADGNVSDDSHDSDGELDTD
jgi:curved DNA-binding protein CbpA